MEAMSDNILDGTLETQAPFKVLATYRVEGAEGVALAGTRECLTVAEGEAWLRGVAQMHGITSTVIARRRVDG